MAQATNVELPYEMTFLLWCEFELQFELVADESIFSVAFRSGHQSRVYDVFHVLLAHKQMVKKMSMSIPMMHPCCFQAVILLEDCI